MQTTGQMPKPKFLILLTEAVVALDIEYIIRDLLPDASVFVARTPEEGGTHLAEGPVAVAFVQQDLVERLLSAIGRSLAAVAARVVFVGAENSGIEESVATLPFPFSREDVEALLSGTLLA